MKVLLCLLLSTSAFAQDNNLRVLIHPTFTLNQNWFLPVWMIGNAKTQTPNNFNLISGVGYRRETWWAEAMIQRQWSSLGDQWFMNFRFSKSHGRLTLYAEPTIFLTKPSFQESGFMEYRVWRKFGLGGETENIHRPNAPDTLGMGPRASYAFPEWKHIKLVVAITDQFRKKEKDVRRLYVVLHRRF